ncbi:MAG: hypothetical protein AABZ11_03675 [Nitrospinota bacterium]
MAHTAKKINFMISDDVREEFEQLIPPGERSKVVNEALRKELISIKRKRLTEKLLTLKVRGPSVSHKDIVEAVRKNRLRDS